MISSCKIMKNLLTKLPIILLVMLLDSCLLPNDLLPAETISLYNLSEDTLYIQSLELGLIDGKVDEKILSSIKMRKADMHRLLPGEKRESDELLYMYKDGCSLLYFVFTKSTYDKYITEESCDMNLCDTILIFSYEDMRRGDGKLYYK